MKPNRNNILFTLIAVSILLAIGFSHNYAIVPWVIVFLPWLLYTPVRLVWLHSGKHFSWRNWGIQFAIWLLAWATLAVGQERIERHIRRDATQIAMQIEQYQAQHQQYPATLGDVYPSNTVYYGRCVRYQSPSQQQPPIFEYASIGIIDWYRYDFATREWQYQSY